MVHEPLWRSKVAKTKEKAVTAVDETTAATPEPVIVDGQDINTMGQEEILALIAARRAEYQAAEKVAKAKGIITPKASKPKVSDVEQLDRLFNRLGYSAGMRTWADGRMDNSGTRIAAAVGDSLADPERADELITAMAEGYREAKIQTSFASNVMKTKEDAKSTPVADIVPEVVAHLQDKGWDFLEAVRQA